MAPDQRLCPRCWGMGHLAYDVQPGHALFGKTTPCPTCAGPAQSAYREAIAGLPADLRTVHFLPAPAWQMPAVTHLQNILSSRAPAGFVTLHGPCGVGKSHLLAAAVNAAKAAGWPAIYTLTADLLAHLRRAYAPDAAQTSDELSDRYRQVRVLALDELALFNPTPWAAEQFTLLIEHRYENASERLTLVASDAAWDDLPPRIVSRLRDARHRVFEFGAVEAEAVDLRQIRA